MAPDRSSEAASNLEFESAERALTLLPDLELLGLLRGSSNYTFLGRLGGGAGDGPASPLLAVYKPAQGESPLWDFEAGTLYRREVAAYLLSRRLGWPRIPPTVVRTDAPHGVGALQLFVDADPELHYFRSGGQPAQAWLEVAAFDVVANNADRKSGHCLIDRDSRLWLIDHGLTFHTEVKLRTVIWDYAGWEIPPAMGADLERTAEDLDADFGQVLGELLSRGELRVLQRRLAAAARPGFRLPSPQSAWSVPWPPV